VCVVDELKSVSIADTLRMKNNLIKGKTKELIGGEYANWINQKRLNMPNA
jgi:hypothetical protein